uniref:uncharacterized protein LOC114670532 isoform X2 n=1 Tax=Macaca mulatta TaxID=9544 RepID=UPI0010A264E0|nr:uncharacterized protein LOC114670532 isoform X2 [Macaca mulatta]
MGNRFSCFQGDSKKPSKKHVKREPCSTTTVTSSSTINEILRRYSLYTTQRWRHHGFWGRKKVHPQEVQPVPLTRGQQTGQTRAGSVLKQKELCDRRDWKFVRITVLLKLLRA